MLASPHPPDRDAGTLGVVPAPLPRGASFTGSLAVHPEPMSTNSTGRLSRASSSQSVGSSVPRSSSFTRSRKFARGDVLSLDDARHVLDSTVTNYAGSLKFAAAQQILAEHLPSVPERGAEPVVAPPPPSMPTNEVKPPSNLRQPGPLPKRMPIPLIKSKPKPEKRPVTPPPPKVEQGGTFNILVPAASHTPVNMDESSPEEKKKGRAFGRVFSRAMSNKIVNASSSASLPDLPVSTPQPVEEKEKEKPKKVLRFDDRSTDIHIDLESTPKSTAPAVVEGGFDKLRARASLPTFSTAPSRSEDNVDTTSAARRLLRARTFFATSRSSVRNAPSVEQTSPANESTTKTEPLENDEQERLAPKPRVGRTLGANAAQAARLSFVSSFGQKRNTSAVNASNTPGETSVKPQRFDSTTTAAQVQRSASSKFLSFFGDNRAARESRASSAHVSEDKTNANASTATEATGVVTAERNERPAKMVVVSNPNNETTPAKAKSKENEDRVDEPTKVQENGSLTPATSIRRFLRTSSKNESAISSAKQEEDSASDAANSSPKEPTAIQKSIAKAQAASASFVARAKKIPRSSTFTRMQNTFSRNSSLSNVAVASTPATGSGNVTRENSELGEVPLVHQKNQTNDGVGKRMEDEKKSMPEPKNTNVADQESKNSSEIDIEKIAPNKINVCKNSDLTLQNVSSGKDRKAENDVMETPVDPVSATPMTEERAASDFGATTKDIPEFVTIKRVIRRKKPDGTEEVITKRIRERPSAVRPNGDVVVQRTVRRLKKDGSGEKETVVIEKVIPRRNQGSSPPKDRPGEAFATGTDRQRIVASQSGRVQSTTKNAKGNPVLKTSSSTSVIGNSSQNKVTAAVADWNKAVSRGEPELRDEDWPMRYKSLKDMKHSSSAENVVKEEMNQVEERVQKKNKEAPPSSFGMIQQGLPRGSSFHGQEPYEHGTKERLVRMPGAQTYTNLSVVPVESTGRSPSVGPNKSFSARSGKGKKGTFRKSAGVDREVVPIDGGADVKGNKSNDEVTSKPDRAQRRWPKLATTGSGHRRASITRVLSLDSNRRSQSDFEKIDEEIRNGNSQNNRPGKLPKSSSVGGSPTRQPEQSTPDRFKVRSKFAGMLSSLRNRFQGTTSTAAA